MRVLVSESGDLFLIICGVKNFEAYLERAWCLKICKINPITKLLKTLYDRFLFDIKVIKFTEINYLKSTNLDVYLVSQIEKIGHIASINLRESNQLIKFQEYWFSKI